MQGIEVGDEYKNLPFSPSQSNLLFSIEVLKCAFI